MRLSLTVVRELSIKVDNQLGLMENCKIHLCVYIGKIKFIFWIDCMKDKKNFFEIKLYVKNEVQFKCVILE